MGVYMTAAAVTGGSTEAARYIAVTRVRCDVFLVIMNHAMNVLCSNGSWAAGFWFDPAAAEAEEE